MSIWSSLLGEPGRMWHLGRIESDIAAPAVVTDESYVSIHLNVAHLEKSRRGTKKFYGVVGSSFELNSLADGRSRFAAVHSPDWLSKIDDANLDRVVQSDVLILGPRPFVGGQITFEIGLFSQPGVDLAAPFIKLLTKISDVAGVSLLASASPVVPLIDAGAELLFGGDEAALEIGAFGTLPEPVAGTWALVRSEDISPTKQVAYTDGRLRWESGTPVTDAHLVFTVSGSPGRPDWRSIPDLRETWDDCRKAIRNGDHRQVDEILPVFRRLAMTSYELLPSDGERLAAWATQTAKDILGAGPTSLGAIDDVPTLESFDLFSTSA